MVLNFPKNESAIQPPKIEVKNANPAYNSNTVEAFPDDQFNG